MQSLVSGREECVDQRRNGTNHSIDSTWRALPTRLRISAECLRPFLRFASNPSTSAYVEVTDLHVSLRIYPGPRQLIALITAWELDSLPDQDAVHPH
jgi:hypothetical protein